MLHLSHTIGNLMKLNLSALSLILLTAPVLADEVEILWNQAGRFQHEGNIKAGGILEVCGKLPAALSVDWSFESAAALESNIHYHEGKKVIFPAKHAAATAVKDSLTTKLAQEYCWMWSNRTPQAVQIKLELAKLK